MKLKPVTSKELDLLIDIAHKTYRAHYQYLWKDKGEHYIKTSYHKAAFTKELLDKNVGLYLITNEGTTYGYLKLNFDAPLKDYTAEEALELERIYLLKKSTGKGLGKAVMNAVDSIAKNLNKKVIWLKTMDNSNAQYFYRKCGYTVSGKTMLNVAGIFPDLQQQLIMEKGLFFNEKRKERLGPKRLKKVINFQLPIKELENVFSDTERHGLKL